MEIFVKAQATIKDLIRDYPDKGALVVHLQERATLADLINVLNLSAEQVNLTVINGTSVYTDLVLHPGDIVELFPYIAGG